MAGQAINPFNGLINNPTVPSVMNIAPNPAPPQCNIVWVDGMEEVLNHPTTPNSNMYFAERNNPIIWVRETDSTGKIKNPLHKLPYTMEEVPFGPEANFVTKDEHQKLFDLVQSMNDKLEQLLHA